MTEAEAQVTIKGAAAQSPIKGVVLVTLAVMVFAVGDVITKHLTMLHAVPLVVALRYLVNLVLLVVFFAPRHGLGLLHTNRTGLAL